MPDPFSINDMINNFQDNILPAIAPMMGGISDQVNIPAPEVNINNDSTAIVNNGQGYVDTGTNTNQQPQQPVNQDYIFQPSSVPNYFYVSNTANLTPLVGGTIAGDGTRIFTLPEIQALAGQQGIGGVQFDLMNGTGLQTVQQAAQAVAPSPVYTQAVPGAFGYTPTNSADAIQQETAIRDALIQQQMGISQALSGFNPYEPPATLGSQSNPYPYTPSPSSGLSSSQSVYGSILPSSASGGDYASTGNNIYGLHNYGDLDQRLITGAYQGTPWYQVTGAQPTYTPEEQKIIDKINRWNSLTPQQQSTLSSNPDYFPSTEERAWLSQSVMSMTYEEQNALKNFMYEQNKARGQALMDSASSIYDLNYQVGLALQNNSHASQISLLDPNSKVVLPEGNQLGRILQSAAHQRVTPTQSLVNFANTYDAYADWFNPSGIWNAWVPSGSREGMGGYGTGSFFTGIPDVVYPGGDRAYTNGSNYAGSGNYQDGRSIIGPVLPPGYRPPSASPTTSGNSRIVTGEILGKNKGVQDYGPGTGQPIADLSKPGNWGYPNDPTIFAPQPFDYIGPDSSSGQVPAFPDNSNPLTTRQYLTDPQTGQVVLNPDGSPQYLDRTYNPVPTSRYLNGGNNSAYIPYDGNSSMADIIPPFQSSMGEIVRNNTPFADGSDYIQNLMGGYAPGTALDNLAPNSPALNSHAGSMGGGVQNFGTGFAQGMFDAYYGYNGQGAGIYPASDVFGTTGYGPATNYVHYKR